MFTVQRMQSTGVNLPEARQIVATVLAKKGIRPARKGSAEGTGQISAGTLRKWQDDIGINMEATKTLREAEAAHLKEVLERCGVSALPTGSTADDLLLQRFAAADLRRDYADKLAAYIVRTRSQEAT